MKEKIKHIIGFFRANFFRVKLNGCIYMGKGCSIKGKMDSQFGSNVTICPYAQIWLGGL